MKPLLVTTAAVFLVTFLAAPTMGAGCFWDVGNGLGFAAFAGLLYLTITSNRRLEIRAHQLLGYAVFALVVFHGFWFLLGDATVAEFLKIGAPDYMWLGVASLVLLALLLITASVPERFRLHDNYPSFKYWHRVLTVAMILSAAYHIVVSDFYLHAWYQGVLFVLLAVGVCLGRAYWVRLGQIDIATPVVYLSVSAVSLAVFVAVRNVAL